MSFLLSSRMRRWVVLAVAVPLASMVLAKVADRMRAKNGGDTTVTKLLRAPQNWRQRKAAA